MNPMMSRLSAIPPAVADFLSRPIYVLGALLLLLCAVVLVKYLVVDLPRRYASEDRGTKVDVSPKKRVRTFPRPKEDPVTPVPNEEDARVAAAIAASIAVMEDQALVAAITAAVRVYLEAENGGKTLPSGFRVVSFRRRRTGSWNR